MDKSNLKEKEPNYYELRGDSYGNFQLQPFVYNILPKDKNAMILDIGCGLCKYLSKIKELGFINLKGIDITDEAINSCKKFGIEAEKIEDVINYSFRHIQEYDFIILAHVLEHIDKDKIIETLKSIKKMLKTNGCLYIVVPNASSNTGCYWAYEDFTHTTLFTSGSLIYVLKAAGFSGINFVDPLSIEGLKFLKKIKRLFFLKIYKRNYRFWNYITDSYFHDPSPLIFSFELKAIAKP